MELHKSCFLITLLQLPSFPFPWNIIFYSTVRFNSFHFLSSLPHLLGLSLVPFLSGCSYVPYVASGMCRLELRPLCFFSIGPKAIQPMSDPTLASILQSLAYRRAVALPSPSYQCYLGFVPMNVSVAAVLFTFQGLYHAQSTGHPYLSHSLISCFSVSIFFSRTAKLLDILPFSVFPMACGLPSVENKANELLSLCVFSSISMA